MSDKITYTQVKEAIPDLTEREIKDLFNRCKALIKAEPIVNDNTDWLLDGILNELRANGVYIPALHKIKSLPNFPSFTEKSAHLRTVLEQQGISSKTEKRQLALICSKCMIEYLKSFTDVSLHTMLQYIDSLPQALERAFPGYMNSRMLMFLIKRDTLH